MSIRENIVFLLLGWFLGLLSPVIVDLIKQRLSRKALRSSFFNELADVRERLVSLVHRIEAKFGKYDRELLLWVRSNMKDTLEMVDSGEEPSKVIERLLQSTDEELMNIDSHNKTTGGDNLTLKKIELPLIDSKLDSLSRFDVEFQRKLLDIRTQLNFMNEEIEQSRLYFKMTFDGGISDENHNLIRKNLTDSNLHISQISRTIVEKVNAFVQVD